MASSRKQQQQQRCYNRACIVGQLEEGEQGDESKRQSPSGQQPRLGSILKNKQRILQAQLSSLRDGELEKRLSSVEPDASPYRLLDVIAGQLSQGKTTIVAEIARLSPSETLESFTKRCVEYTAWGKIFDITSLTAVPETTSCLSFRFQDVALSTMKSFRLALGLTFGFLGADALAICTDEEKSPNGAQDLAAACKGTEISADPGQL